MDNDIETMVSYAFSVTLIRFINNTFLPTTFNVMCALSSGTNNSDNNIELGLAKTKYWIDNLVSKCIAFNKDNELAFDMLLNEEGTPRVGNIFMMCPAEPCDETIGTLLQAKINALANDAFKVESLEISSDNLDGLSFILAGDHSSNFPTTMKEWLDEDENYFDVPWWRRDDASTLDVYLSEDSNPKDVPAWAFSLDFLDKNKKVEQLEKSGFRPRVIKGGKEDE